jgi:hypothetical protein
VESNFTRPGTIDIIGDGLDKNGKEDQRKGIPKVGHHIFSTILNQLERELCGVKKKITTKQQQQQQKTLPRSRLPSKSSRQLISHRYEERRSMQVKSYTQLS